MIANRLRPLRAHPDLLVVGAAVLVLATAPMAIDSDGLARFKMLTTLLRDGQFERLKYSLIGPLAAAPLWYLGTAVGYPQEVVWVFNRCVAVAAVAGLWAVLRPVLPREERVRFAVLVLAGSTLPWHAMGFFAEVFHTMLVGAGLALLATGRRGRAVLGGALCVAGTANMPGSAVGLALACAVLAAHRRRLRYALVPAGAAALVLFENYLRRGGAFDGGYDGEAGNRTALPYSGLPGFSYPIEFGVLSVLFSFGKGLVFFTPGLFFAYPRGAAPRDAAARLVYRAWVAVVVGLVLVYARWWAWYGGAVWGPRFFLFAVLPAALVLARRTARPAEHSTAANALALVAVVLSCWVGANGITFRGRGSERFWADDFALESFTWYVPECSVLWLPFVERVPLEWYEYPRLAAFAACGGYLAWPVGRVLAARAAAALPAAWDRFRAGPRWRF